MLWKLIEKLKIYLLTYFIVHLTVETNYKY